MDEIEAIIAYSIDKAKQNNDISYLAIPLFFYTGLRIGECLGLAFGDCRKEDHTIYVHQMLAVKDERLPNGTWKTREYEIVDFLKGNGDPREVLVSDAGFKIIDILRELQPITSGSSDLLFPVFPNTNKKEITGSLIKPVLPII